MTLRYAGLKVELREVALKNKPHSMLDVSQKGTVPVLVREDGSVLDESIDIMNWVLEKSDPNHWLENRKVSNQLILLNDGEFKYWLDRYKYHVGYPEHSQSFYFDKCLDFINELESQLNKNKFLIGDTIRLADIAIFPFIRQFAFCDKKAFDALPIPATHKWINHFLHCPTFIACMKKYRPWQEGTVGEFF